MIEVITALDPELLWCIKNHICCPLLDYIMIPITHLGDRGAIWVIIAVVLIAVRRTRKIGLAMAISMLLCLIIGNFGLKPLFSRIRPFHADPSISLLIPAPGEFSFPSGHTMCSFAAASALCCYNKKAGLVSFVLAALIGFSRLYLMVHYPTDVVVGCFLGIVFGAMAHIAVEHIVSGRIKTEIKR